MDAMQPDDDLARLTRHSAFLASLARGLVGPGADADDLQQEVWLAALAGEASVSSPRGWLATVARRLASRQRTSEARRRERERLAAREESEAEEELGHELEIAERLTAAVRRLEEPLRMTLHLHYAEGLSATAIARRMQVPVETVRTRIKRSLARLREDLARQLGDDERGWRAALAPLVSLPTLRTLQRGGLFALSWKLGTATAAFVALVYVCAPDSGSKPLIPLTPALTPSAHEELAAAPAPELARRRAPAPAGTPAAGSASAPAPALAPVTTRADATPIGRLTGVVYLQHDAPTLPPLDLEELVRTSACGPPLGMDTTDRRLRVDELHRLRDVVIVLRVRGAQVPRDVVPRPERTLTMRAGRFEPYVTIAPHGARLRLANEARENHVVHSYAKQNPAFNVTVPFGRPFERTFALESAERFEVKDDLRPWMSAWVCVESSPHVAITDEHGAFTLEDLPPGQWFLRAWHPLFGEVKVRDRVSIEANETTTTTLGLVLDQEHLDLLKPKERAEPGK
ncbi:MAG: RNA polymerase sigma factor [Planctomycetes bacterium]|nr:RNA polymerase sigma factor [Planctomycetota bacterium]